MRRRVLGMILAGGRGNRLQPLTRFRSKPAVPFGGMYRIVDFVLSNFVNSGIKSIYVLTQFLSQSLVEHIHRAWTGTHLMPGNFIIPVPAQMQTGGEIWYRGTADSIYQNMNLVRETLPDLVCIFGGDHIYFMDIGQMLRAHVASGAEATVASLPLPRGEASAFGVIEVEKSGRVVGFHEKVEKPPTVPDDAARCLVSLGNYVFHRQILDEVLEADAKDPSSSHDFGKDILPRMVASGRRVFSYDFESNRIPGRPDEMRNTYWRDVGTVDAYYDANLDLKEVVPKLDLYNRDWNVHTAASNSPPAKFVQGEGGKVAEVHRTIVGPGSVLSGCRVEDCVLGRRVRVQSHATVAASILMDGVTIEAGCRVQRAIVDKNVVVARGTDVGFRPDADRDRGWTVTESGITVIPKNPVVRPVTTVEL
ncbi:MAG: glucose-1-phosphate adenylyltransferase [Planctomycetota bacterium]